MKFGDKVRIKDGSLLDGCDGIAYRLEEERIFVLLDRQVLWPVNRQSVLPCDTNE